MDEIPAEAWDDPMHPPSIPIEVHCIHCGNEYESYRIEWREEMDADGSKHCFWCCPIPGCDGKGFCFDIFPTDPDYVDERTGEKIWMEDHEDDCECDECKELRAELEVEFGPDPNATAPAGSPPTSSGVQPSDHGADDDEAPSRRFRWTICFQWQTAMTPGFRRR